MQEIARLSLLPLVVLVVDLGGTFGADQYAPKNLFSPEAKGMVVRLQQYMIDLDNSFNVIGSQLKEDNNVLQAVQNYQNTYEEAKITTCKGEKRSADEDTDLIATFIDDCVESLPVNDLAAFNNKIRVSKAKVKVIDESLKENESTCPKNPTSCEENKTKLLKDLDNVLSAEEKEEFQKFAKRVLAKAQKHLDSCFSDESEDLLHDLEKATSKINECLSSKTEE